MLRPGRGGGRERDRVSGPPRGGPLERLRVVEDHLAPLVLVAAVLGSLAPAVGIAMSRAVTWLLALLMFSVSLTFDLDTVRRVLRRPGVQVVATGLVYGPMSLAGHLLGHLLFGAGPFGLGFALVGSLPTDVSSPLLVLLARGNVALATVLNAVNTALAPVLVPALFLLYTGVELEVSLTPLIGELALTVLLPTVAGVAIRTWRPRRVEPLEPALSATASVAYLSLVLAVVGPSADAIAEQPGRVALAVVAALALNGIGYLLGWAVGPLLPATDRSAMVFTVSKKEFSIAAFLVVASGLPPEVALPAVVYAVVQMLTSPIVARTLARRAGSVPVAASQPGDCPK